MSNDFHSLWIGEKLGEPELLTLYSFAENGHSIQLWAYQKIQNAPNFTIVKDANEIISASKVFKYDTNSAIDWGKGSYGGFSDIFRYKLLYEYGGWWVDTDVTCLRPFNITEEYFFRNHWKLPVVGNVLKCPKGSELMKACYDRAVIEVTPENTDWHKPITILNEEIERLNLTQYRKSGLFNLDMKHTIEPYLIGHYPFPAGWLGVHWINSAGISYKIGSSFHRLLNKYGIECF